MIGYLRGMCTPHTDWLEAQLPRERLGLTDLILCEVLQGIPTDKQLEAVQDELLKFAVFETGMVGVAVEATLNYRRLRTAARTVRKTSILSSRRFVYWKDMPYSTMTATMIHLKICSV